MLVFIPVAGLLIGLYAALTFGRQLMLLVWLSAVAVIVGVHTYAWRDVYFSNWFSVDTTLLVPQNIDLFSTVATVADRAQLGIATAFLLIVGVGLSGLVKSENSNR